jgi:hypothetical protein
MAALKGEGLNTAYDTIMAQEKGQDGIIEIWQYDEDPQDLRQGLGILFGNRDKNGNEIGLSTFHIEPNADFSDTESSYTFTNVLPTEYHDDGSFSWPEWTDTHTEASPSAADMSSMMNQAGNIIRLKK